MRKVVDMMVVVIVVAGAVYGVTNQLASEMTAAMVASGGTFAFVSLMGYLDLIKVDMFVVVFMLTVTASATMGAVAASWPLTGLLIAIAITALAATFVSDDFDVSYTWVLVAFLGEMVLMYGLLKWWLPVIATGALVLLALRRLDLDFSAEEVT